MVKDTFNNMCVTCKHLGAVCKGTKDDTWTGCALRDRPVETVRDYFEEIGQAISNSNKIE